MEDFEKKLNYFIKMVQEKHILDYKKTKFLKQNPLYLKRVAAIEKIQQYFDENLKSSKKFLRFHWRVGRPALCPWIEVSKKPANKGNIEPFICIIFSQTTKTPFITLQLPVDKQNSKIVKQICEEYRKEIKYSNITMIDSYMNLECLVKGKRCFNYEHIVNVYSQKYTNTKQIDLFFKILSTIKEEKASLTKYKQERINTNYNHPQNHSISQDYIEGKVKSNNFGEISLRAKNRLLKSKHMKCTLCTYDHHRILQVALIKEFLKPNNEKNYDMSNGFVFCPLHYRLYKKEIIILKMVNDNLVFSINDKFKDEMFNYKHLYSDWYDHNQNIFKTKAIPSTYDVKEIRRFL